MGNASLLPRGSVLIPAALYDRENHKLPTLLTFPMELYNQAASFRDSNAHLLSSDIPEQRLDLLGPESDTEDATIEESLNVRMTETYI